VGFGRREIKMSAREIEHGRVSDRRAECDSHRRRHESDARQTHGALSNMAHVDSEYAGAIARAIKSVDPDLIFVAIACSEMVTAGRKEGLRVAEEAFATAPTTTPANSRLENCPTL
jgi:UPF0271 protein